MKVNNGWDDETSSGGAHAGDLPTIDFGDSGASAPTIDFGDSGGSAPTMDFGDSGASAPTIDFGDAPTIDFGDTPTIDFGDGGAALIIDFGDGPRAGGGTKAEGTSKTKPIVESILHHTATRNAIIDELVELTAFLSRRLKDQKGKLESRRLLFEKLE